eukprot:gene41252-55797_t
MDSPDGAAHGAREARTPVQLRDSAQRVRIHRASFDPLPAQRVRHLMPHPMPIPSTPPSLALRALLVAIAIAAIVVPALIVLRAPPVVPTRHFRAIPARVVPKAELPPVEPVAFEDMSLDDARAYNASIPFVGGPNPAARPFKFVGSDEQRARARDCLAVAMLYEAGDDSVGQRAVAQVVINRARHPAFPKTICGVVFQGSERSTGCGRRCLSLDLTVLRQRSEPGHRRPDVQPRPEWILIVPRLSLLSP